MSTRRVLTAPEGTGAGPAVPGAAAEAPARDRRPRRPQALRRRRRIVREGHPATPSTSCSGRGARAARRRRASGSSSGRPLRRALPPRRRAAHGHRRRGGPDRRPASTVTPSSSSCTTSRPSRPACSRESRSSRATSCGWTSSASSTTRGRRLARPRTAGTAGRGRGQVMEGKDALGWLLAPPSRRGLRGAERAAPAARREGGTVERYADGATVVLAGARGDSMHIILNGRARVRTPGGHTRTLGDDDCFGELALLDGGNRSATVTAVGELTTARSTARTSRSC